MKIFVYNPEEGTFFGETEDGDYVVCWEGNQVNLPAHVVKIIVQTYEKETEHAV